MVLADDELRTIVLAMEQGRVIYRNIRKFVVYLMSCNISELMLVAVATLAGAPLPLLPMQILFLNLVTDVFPALALGVGEGDRMLMRQPPRNANEPILTLELWLQIAAFGFLICISVLSAMFIAIKWLALTTQEAVTVSFLTLAFAQLWHVINMRAKHASWLRNEIVTNLWVWAAIVLCIGLLLLAMHLPLLSQVLQLKALNAPSWTLVIVMSLLPACLGSAVPPLVRFAVQTGRG